MSCCPHWATTSAFQTVTTTCSKLRLCENEAPGGWSSGSPDIGTGGAPLLQGHIERLEDQLGAQVRRHDPAHDAPTPDVQADGQVSGTAMEVSQ